MKDNEHIIDLIPAFVLSALDSDEAALVKAHLKICKYCQSELEAYNSISEKLSLAVPTFDPPADLRNKILQAVSDKPRPARSGVKRDRFRAIFQSQPAAWVLVGALVLVLVVSNLLLWQEVNILRESAEQIRFSTIAMTGTEAAPLATGMVIISPDGQYGTLVVDGLPYLESSYEYQLWLIRDGGRTSGGMFSVNERGYASMQIYAHEPLISYPGFGITVEPTGGSSEPTGDKVLGGEL